MKKYIFILVFFLLPSFVYAEEIVEEDSLKPIISNKVDKNNVKWFSSLSFHDLFSWAGAFSYPLEFPKWQRWMNVGLALRYNSYSQDAFWPYGYAWSIDIPTIQRDSRKWVSELYKTNSFVAGGQELVMTSTGIYESKNANDFSKYLFDGTSWTVKDTKWNVYIYGSTSSWQLVSPLDTAKVYAWYLQKVEDNRGNKVLYSYFKDANQVYIDKIEYVFVWDIPLYKIQFNYQNKARSLTSYRTQFEVKTTKLLQDITLYTDNAETKKYLVQYDSVDNPYSHLTQIKEVSWVNNRSIYDFIYGTGKDIHLLTSLHTHSGLKVDFTYKPSVFYKEDGQNANSKLPFNTKTLHVISYLDEVTSQTYTETYDYAGGDYYYDSSDIYGREYAGFHKVSKTDSLGKKEVTYFHQWQGSEDGSIKGEYQDHISKKWRSYRYELYSASWVLEKTNISKYDSLDVGNGRYIVNKTRDVEILKNGTSKATEYIYDSFTNPTTTTLYGSVTVSNAAWDFTDIGTDKRTIESTYINDTTINLIGFPTSQILKDNSGNVASKKEFFYDEQGFGTIIKWALTKERVYTSSTEYFDSQKQYSSQGLVIKTTNPRGYEQHMVYDSYGLYPVQVTNAKWLTESYEYDYAFGQPTKHTDVNGLERRFEYDNFGRPTRESVVLGTTDTTLKLTSYDDASIPNRVYQKSYYDTGANDSVESYTYLDAQGNVIQSKQKYQDKYITTKLKYDSRGNTVYTTYPIYETGSGYTLLNQTVEKGDTTAYDDLDRVKQISNASGNITYTYNDTSFTLTNQKGVSHSYHYDLFGNLVKVIEPGNLQTLYDYSTSWNLTQITDALWNIRHISYDLAGRRLEIEDLHAPSDTNFWKQSYTYDANGNVLTMKTMSDDLIVYTYDELDRPSTESVILGLDPGIPPLEQTNFVYDSWAYAKGQLTSYSKWNYSESYSYNALGQKITDTKNYNGTAYTQGYSYALGGQVKTITYPDSKVTTYVYSDGVLSGVSYDGVALTTGIEYNEVLKVKELQYGNGAEDIRNYDYTHGYRLASKTLTSSGQTLSALSYTFDPVWNITTLSEQWNQLDFQKTVDYTYDNLNRLTYATYDFSTGATLNISYTYDALWNILTNSEIGNYTYTDQWRNNPHAVSQVWSTNYSYDTNGNVDNETHSWSTIISYTYNPKNELLNSQIGTGSTTNYTYDSNGIRTQKVTNTKINRYVNKEYEVEVNGSWTGQTIEINKYIFFNWEKLSTVKLKNTSEEIIYHCSDHLSSANIDMSDSNIIQQQIDYLPYGKTRNIFTSSEYQNEYQFWAKELDSETDLNYFEARYYWSTIGKFYSIDNMFWSFDRFLLDPQQLNAYSFARNNPIIFTDPTWEEITFWWTIYSILWISIAEAPNEENQQQIHQAQKDINDSETTGDVVIVLASLWAWWVKVVAKKWSEKVVERVVKTEVKEVVETEVKTEIKKQSNRFNHIFWKKEHNLDSLVKKYWTEEDAFNAVQNSANKQLEFLKKSADKNWILPKWNDWLIINVEWTNVRLIWWKVEWDKVIISSFSRKWLE